MGPRISVLLPTHDRADVIGLAIASVLAQTEPDFELLIVGDGCTDGTASVVEAFDDERIRWFDLPKAPSFGYANRNTVLREARGELIAFLAHDDLLLPDHLELLGQAFDSPAVEWAYSRPLWMDDDGTAVPLAVDLRRPDAFRSFMESANTIPASCVVYRRTNHEHYGYWPEDVERGGDWDLWRRMVGPSGGANLAYVPTVTCIHFRAQWRERRGWGPSEVSGWLEQATSGWWPAALRLAVPAGSSVQEYTWRRIADDGEAWVTRLREAVIDVVDGFAWATADLRWQWRHEAERADALQGRVDEQTAEVERRVLESKRLRQQIVALRSTNTMVLRSRSWRMTAPIRTLHRRVRDLVARSRPS